jgi:hypothetical protein
MVDVVDLDEQGVDDVVADELEVGVREEMPDVVLRPGEEVVDADDVRPLRDEPVREVASEETRAARDEDALQL